ncbi:MAG TPA: hypothetical protein VN345_15620, partial [Blastocatellia bacterium]|nr:hypothetical protein [Blastocatellia bacterium]
VKDIALHLLGGEVGILSRKRDGWSAAAGDFKTWDELVAFINDINDTWIKATRRISPPLLCDLLTTAGTQVCKYFESLDPFALDDPVNWAGPEPAPVWLDLAREYSERWHHQQQIRDAVGIPGLKQRRYFHPVLDAFVRALPHTYSGAEAPEGTAAALTISGDSGGRWCVVRENGHWDLYVDPDQQPYAEVEIDQDIAWRLFTKGVSRSEAEAKSIIRGDRAVAVRMFEMVSVIA